MKKALYLSAAICLVLFSTTAFAQGPAQNSIKGESPKITKIESSKIPTAENIRSSQRSQTQRIPTTPLARRTS
jgi:hypothetical protein